MVSHASTPKTGLQLRGKRLRAHPSSSLQPGPNHRIVEASTIDYQYSGPIFLIPLKYHIPQMYLKMTFGNHLGLSVRRHHSLLGGPSYL